MRPLKPFHASLEIPKLLLCFFVAPASWAPRVNEADTCRKLVLPRLLAAGWVSEPHSVAEQRTITDGRIVPAGRGFIRKPPRRVDYLLRDTRDFPLAVVEAKPAYKTAADGLQQAKDCAGMLGLKFADATNGHDIVEWIAAQAWCSGKVGMMGISWFGMIQRFIAAQALPGVLIDVHDYGHLVRGPRAVLVSEAVYLRLEEGDGVAGLAYAHKGGL